MNRIKLDNGIVLIHGDCLEVMPKIKDNVVDMVLVDLPYGTTACKWDSLLPLDVLWREYLRLCKENAAMCFTSSQPFTTVLNNSMLSLYRYEWIWRKDRATLFQHANKMPMKKHEVVSVFYRKLPTYNPQFSEGKPYTDKRTTRKRMEGLLVGGAQKIKIPVENEGIRYPTSDLFVPCEVNRKHNHPSQKPVLLMEYLIKTYTDKDDLVLDNTMGSGTTGVACINTGRRFIGIEKEKNYFDIAVTRCREALAAQKDKEVTT